jgi:uncharacterized membrane protein
MQCPVCHNEVGAQSAFCGHCGATISASAPEAIPPSVPYTPAPASAYPAPVAAASTGLTPNAAAAISYITFIPAILFLLIEPYNKTPIVRFHSFQSIGLAVAWFATWVVVFMGSMMLAIIPGVRILVLLIPFLYFALGLCVFILWLMAVIKASKGEWFKLPIIGDFAMKQAQS